jgi:hypothetical protein
MEKKILMKKLVLLASVLEPAKLLIFTEGLKSNQIDFETRKGSQITETDIYVREEDLEIAKSIIEEGEWGEVI